MPCASKPSTMPPRTSPAPAVASVGGALALTMARPPGAAITVSLPLLEYTVGVSNPATDWNYAHSGHVAKTSVVRCDDLRHHTVENLHVIDGSVLPTSLGVNPQQTIYGIAHLIATRLAAAPS